MNKENNMELKSEYVEVEVLGYGLPLYNAIGSSGDKVIYEGIEYDSTMINAWEVLTGSSTIQIGGQCCNQHKTASFLVFSSANFFSTSLNLSFSA